MTMAKGDTETEERRRGEEREEQEREVGNCGEAEGGAGKVERERWRGIDVSYYERFA